MQPPTAEQVAWVIERLCVAYRSTVSLTDMIKQLNLNDDDTRTLLHAGIMDIINAGSLLQHQEYLWKDIIKRVGTTAHF
jgi:hypothetical protein